MKKTITTLLLILSLFLITACNSDDNSTTNKTSEVNIMKYTIDDAKNTLYEYFNKEEGINFNHLDTISVIDNNMTEEYYKIDVRRYNGTVNSRLDIYYVCVNDQGKSIYDSAKFKEKFGTE